MHEIASIIIMGLVSIIISGFSFSESKKSRTIEIFERIAVGLVIISYIFLTLGALKILYWWTFWLSVILAIFTSIIRFQQKKFIELKEHKRIRFRIKNQDLIACCTILFIFSPALIRSFGEVTGYDANSYHLPIPYYYMYILHGLDLEYLLPNNGLLPGTFGFTAFLSIFGNPKSSAILTVCFSACTYLYIVKKTKKIYIPSLLFFSILNILSYETYSQPGNDFALTFFTVAIVGSFIDEKWLNINASRYLLLSLLIGFLPVVKIFALPISIVMFLILYSQNKAISHKIKVSGVALAAIPVLYFLLMNLVTFNNPLHPSFSSLFSDKYVLESTSSELEFILSTIPQDFKDLINPPYIFSVENAQFLFLIFTILYFVIVNLKSLRICILNRKYPVERVLFLSLSLILLFEFVIIGNFLRYYLFLIIPLYAFSESLLGDSRKERKRLSSFRLKSSKSLAKGFLAVYFGLILSLIFADKATYFTKANQRIENEEVIGVISSYIRKGDEVCLLGDHRAFLFYPNKVRVFPTNENRNPFYAGSSYDLFDVENYVWEMCSIFILQMTWGFPPGTNIEMIERFKDANQALYAQDGWYIYRK